MEDHVPADRGSESATTAAPAAVERKIVSVLFADLVGFTTLSERLDPEDVATVQDAYFSAVRETIGRYGGRLEKFIGDAAMAVFGSPRTRDDDAERAVLAGLALANAVQQLSARVGLEEGDLRLRVGVNTGEVVHAESGPDEGRVTGDTVNTAARFQTAAPPGGVLIGETTSLAVADSIELQPAGPLDLKGKAEPVRAWHALGVLPHRSREQAMGRLRAQTIGRDEELAVLDAALARVRAHRSERFVIVAPPGVGKTRLVDEFARRSASATTERIAEWRARLRPDVVAPYQPIAQLILAALAGAGLDFREGIPGRAGELLGERLRQAGVAQGRAAVVTEQMLAVIAPPSDEGTPQTDLVGDREALFQAWIEALDGLGADAVQLWLVEDVHWAGGDVLAFLDLAGRTPSPAGRLILATTRPSLLDRSPSWCQPDAEGVSLLGLQPLSAVRTGELIRALVGAALPRELEDRVAERSDGNPLFVEELLRTWISVGTLVQHEEAWRLVAAASEVALPTTVQAIYAGQLDDLPPAPRNVARRASVAGRRFPVGALEPLETPDSEEAIETLVRRALLGSVPPDPLLGQAYAYRHALLRDVGYASLARAERSRLHARLARWLEEAAGARHGEVAELIATHYASALESAPALAKEVDQGLSRDEARILAAGWFERAAEAALSVAAHEAARMLFRRALDLTGAHEVLDLGRRWERLGDATAFAADMDEGGRALEKAVELYRRAMEDDTESAAAKRTGREGYARALAALGMVWNQQLRFEDASRLAEQGLEVLGEGDDLETARLMFLRAWSTTMFALKPEEVRGDLERALELAREHGDRALVLETSHELYHLLVEIGEVDLDEMLRHDREVIRIAGDLGNWQRVVHTTRIDAMMLIEDRVEQAWPLLDEAVAVAAAHGLNEQIAWIDYTRAEAGLISGDWDRAWEAGLRTIEVAERNAYHRAAVRTWFVLVAMGHAQGRRDVLEHADRWFLDHESIFPPSPFGKFMHGAIDLRLTAAGLRDVQPPTLDEVIGVWDETQAFGSVWDAAETITDAWLAAGELEWTGTFLDAMARWHAHPLTTDLGIGSHELIEARLDFAEGKVDQAAFSGGRAMDAFRRCRAPWWISKAIRVLEAAGAATPELAMEASEIEGALRIVSPPTETPA